MTLNVVRLSLKPETTAVPDNGVIGVDDTINFVLPEILVTVVFGAKEPVPEVTVTVIPTINPIVDGTVTVVPLLVAPEDDTYVEFV